MKRNIQLSILLLLLNGLFLFGNVTRPYVGKIEIAPHRLIFLLNNDWQYLEDNCPTMTDLGNSAVPWQNINLPHTWNAFDATDNNPGYRRDISWYKKEIFIPKLKSDQKLYLCFEGVNIVCDVFVNDKRAGGHVGGYVGFEVDITDFVKFGKTNSIRVKVDNSINREIIPSQKSDFFIYGGITRDVYLKVLNPVHIFGMKIFTPQVTEKEAQTYVTVSVQSNTGKTQSIIIKLLNNDGLVVGEKALDQKLNKGQNEVKIDLPTLKNPQLWSPDSPNLYSLEITLENSDQLLQKFGYRWFEFKDKGPFYLNGRRLLLRGTHRHEEWAGYGAAMPNELHRRDMEMIKDMGANFVRLAHYPQDPEIYKACDELGLLVWDELPWCRGGVGNDVWQENTQQLFEEQINQNFNHPSIILWSIGNEMYWLPDFEGGDDKEKLVTFAKELNDIAHKMDPQRKTTMRKFYDGADITDVFSPSIWAGWYSGVYKTYEKALLTSRAKYRHFLHAEYGGSSHVGRHSENPISGEGQVKEDEWAESPNMINVDRIASVGDWSENYIVDLFDWHLKTTEQLDWFIGNAQWAFKDFGTPLRPENPIPYMNQKGLVDRDGNPKDAYYVFKSYWTNNPAFCYIESHTWPERYGKPGEKKELCVFSNCQEVEMVVNGLSYGKKRRDINDFPAAGYHWNVEFDDGKNEILAIGYNGEKQACFDKIEITYTARKIGTPEEILLTAKKLDNGNYLITARVVDKQGTTCLDFNERVYFDCNGGGYLKENLGTPTGSRILEFASGRAHIEYVPEPGLSGIIEARTQDFKGSYLEIKN